MQIPFEKIKQRIEEANTITVLTHINPDADTLGTGLGIYTLLKRHYTKPIEIVNYSEVLPKYLDFLPAFEKIKKKMDFTGGLIITCDCGSIDRLGVSLVGRDILNIDHHQSNQSYGNLNVVIPTAASASHVAYEIFEPLYPISKEVATCFYTALVSDTRFFRTSSVTQEVFHLAQKWLDIGVDATEVASALTQRKSLASIRILQRALGHLCLYHEAGTAVLYVTQEDISSAGALSPDMEGIVEYGLSLCTVNLSVFAMELQDHIRVSLRSKGINVAEIAATFGGGGHKVAAGFRVPLADLEETIDTILSRIAMKREVY